MATTNLRRPSFSAQESIVKYVQNCALFLNNNFNLRQQLLDRDRAYQREMDFTEKQRRLQQQNRIGVPTVENLTIPVVMPQVETATAYLTNTFLNSYPIFPVVSQPTLSPEALQMETVIGDQSTRFGWAAELMMAFRDGLKYNIAAVEVQWQEKRTYSLANDAASSIDKGTAVETYYKGNTVRRLNMYNVIMDTRIAEPSKMHIDGEFAGYTELMSRIRLKKFIADLGPEVTMNAKEAFESGNAGVTIVPGSSAYYVPEINPSALLSPQFTETNWLVWAGRETADRIRYSNMYEVTTLYCRILPVDFGIITSAQNTVQIWKFILVNRRVLIFAERQTNVHDYLGIVFMQPLEDGLGWQTKSFAENAVPMQTAASTLYNAAVESQRRKVFDRLLYDPSRVEKKDIDGAKAVARIPVKQAAYGSNLNEAVAVLPYRDEGVPQILMMSRDIVENANVVTGQNRVSQGQFQKGNKTRKEFEDVMGNSDARMQTMALGLELRFFQPIKEIIKLNILQYQEATTLYNTQTKQNVNINPVDLRTKSIQFKLADGVMSVDKMLNTELFQVAVQMAGSNPMFASQYDVVGATFYYLQMNGASWLQDFMRTPEQQQQYLQQQVMANTKLTGQVGQQPNEPNAQAQPLQ